MFQRLITTWNPALRRSNGPTLTASLTSSSSNNTPVPNPLPASFLRGGTSKGIFLTQTVLPPSRASWTPIFLGLMGSPDAEYGRQLNGMGGGISSLSKIMVVSASSPAQRDQGIQVEYTFAQVGITDSSIDYSGNCGNLTSMVGVYAVDEGLCVPTPTGKGDGRGTVRCFNTNTQKVIDTTFPISDTGVPVLDLPETTMAGVPGKASQIVLDFVDPGGARTGKLLPTGSTTDALTLTLPGPTTTPQTVRATLIDATNPTVFVPLSQLTPHLPMAAYLAPSPPAAVLALVSPVLEDLRKQGAVLMGLDPSAKAQPKIALLSAPDTAEDAAKQVDIVIHALSMGVLHKAVPMTVGLGLGVASKIEGTIAWDIVNNGTTNTKTSAPEPKEKGDLIRIRHPGGLVDVGAEFGADGSVKSAKVVRTGRRLMTGLVWH